ncbi:MAG: hypothetical protein ABF311_04805 [Polaribacter sp.]
MGIPFDSIVTSFPSNEMVTASGLNSSNADKGVVISSFISLSVLLPVLLSSLLQDVIKNNINKIE